MKKNDSFFDAIAKDDLRSLPVDLVEASVDSFLSDGFLKEVPLVGSVLSILKLCRNYRDFLLAKKIFRFLYQLETISPNERFEFIERIDKSSEYESRVTDHLMLILDKADEYAKADLIGILFKMCILGDLAYHEFIRLTHAINNVLFSDLKYLYRIQHYGNRELYNPPDIITINKYLPDFFVSLGLVNKKVEKPKLEKDRYSMSNEVIIVTPEPSYNITELGSKIILALSQMSKKSK